MRVFRYIATALSLYSAIPMPRFDIDEDDMAYCIMFLPFIGCIISVVEYYVNQIGGSFELPLFVRCCLFMVIPVVITGGFHVDGFLDTEDAVRSYRPKEEKLRILSDPHIGAFGVIKLVTAGLFAVSSVGIVFAFDPEGAGYALIFVFVISRGLTGITSICMKKAKDSGMLRAETRINNIVIYIVLIFFTVSSFAAVAMIDMKSAVAFFVSFVLFIIYYRRLVMHSFGGVTGDTAGYFVTASEVSALFCAAAAVMIERIL